MHDEPLWCFIGLGNKGNEYIHTRHNIGRDFVRYLEKEEVFIKLNSKNTRHYILNKFKYNEVNFYTAILKTYMNLSGQALKILSENENIALEQICVVVDDFNIPLEQFKIRLKGSSGNHKGLQSIIDTFQTTNLARIRIGIGPLSGIPTDFVLQKFSKEELKKLPHVLENFISIIKTILGKGFEVAMNNFN
ncbi:MAG: aminoacyl-tRNA hydrolase [Planctomycetota bacterium]